MAQNKFFAVGWSASIFLGLMLMLGLASVYAEVSKGSEVDQWISPVETQTLRGAYVDYEDPNAIFGLLIPAGWRVQRDLVWDQREQVNILTTLITPPNALNAELYGRVTVGIRISIRLPRRGVYWTGIGMQNWRQYTLKGTMEANPNYRLIGTGQYHTEGAPALTYYFSGNGWNLFQPEWAELILLAQPHRLTSIELIAPKLSGDLLRQLEILTIKYFR